MQSIISFQLDTICPTMHMNISSEESIIENASVILKTNLLMICEELKKIYPTKYANAINTNYLNMLNVSNIIKCTNGSSFSKEKQTYDKYNFASLIIIPPISISGYHKGGILKIYDDTIHEYTTENITQWTVVAFNLLLKYEFTQVELGTLIVINSSCFFDANIYDLIDKINCDVSINETNIIIKKEYKKMFFNKVNNNIKKHLDDIKDNLINEDQIEKLGLMTKSLRMTNDINDFCPKIDIETDKINKLFNEIETKTTNIIICCFNDYYENENLLYPSDYALYSKVKEKYKNTHIVNFDIKEIDDGRSTNCSSYEYFGKYLNNDKIKVLNFSLLDKPIYEVEQEYDDILYNIYWRLITCIVIIK